jgi:NAD(P)-dependent dehydrogenase (short-subunit alcohol dehydrogenase family)
MGLLDKRVAVVTGAGRGIGRAIALALAREGYDIAGNDLIHDPRSAPEGLAGTGALCDEVGAAFLPLPADISDLGTHEGLVGIALERFGRIDFLVNNAGVGPLERLDYLETTPESYDRVMGTNLRGPFFLTQRVARHMLAGAEGGGTRRRAIVFITSISVDTSSPSRTEYCLSKAGLSHLARVCAHRLAPQGIAVYEVRPGVIRTEMTAPVTARYDALIADGLIPQGRWGEPEDVGRAVAALARGDFSYSTGGVFEVSGGMGIKRL